MDDEQKVDEGAVVPSEEQEAASDEGVSEEEAA